MRRALVLLALLAAAFSAHASILNPDIINMPGTRGAAMAGAFTAVADDYSAFLWNPAGLVLLEKVSASTQFDFAYAGSRYNFFENIALPADDGTAYSVSYLHGGFNPAQFYIDTLYLSAAAYPQSGSLLSVGLTMKITGVSRKEYGVSASAFLLDAGLMYFPEFLDKKMRFAFTIRDVDAYLTWSTGEKNRLPQIITLGSSYIFDQSALAALDIGVREKSYGLTTMSIALGGEKYFTHDVAGTFGLRAGVNFDGAYDPGLFYSFGLTYKRDSFEIDYAYGPDIRKFGETHKVSLTYNFGPPVKIGDITPKRPTPRATPKTETAAPSPTSTVTPAGGEAASELYPDIKFSVSSRYLNPQRPVVISIDKQPMSLINAVTKIEVIEPVSGKAVRTMSQPGRVPREFTWNALDDKALPVKDGDYNVTLTITEADKVLWRKVRVVTVDTSAPACSINVTPKKFAASPSSLVKNADIVIDPQPYDTAKWTLTIVDAAGSTVRKFSGEGAPGKLFFTGKDALGEYVKDGDYTFVFDIEDFAGNKFRAKDTIKITSETVKFGVNVDNRIFTPGKTSASVGLRFADTADVSTWNLEIMNLDGAVLRAYKNRAAGAAAVSWDGTDEGNEYVPEGGINKYRITVIQKSGMTAFAEGYLNTTLPEFRSTGINLILAAIKFPKGDPIVPAEEYNALSQAAAAIKQYAKEYVVFVRAYASDSGDAVKNFNISVERALAVADYLSEAQGIPRANIKIAAIGDGEFAAGATATSDAAEKGSRVEVELLSK